MLFYLLSSKHILQPRDLEYVYRVLAKNAKNQILSICTCVFASTDGWSSNKNILFSGTSL